MTCANGKILINGKCSCPPGTKEMEDGTCEKEECSSALQTTSARLASFPSQNCHAESTDLPVLKLVSGLLVLRQIPP